LRHIDEQHRMIEFEAEEEALLKNAFS